jgi:hypothetical protein
MTMQALPGPAFEVIETEFFFPPARKSIAP